MTVTDWPHYLRSNTDWKLTPLPSQDGCIDLAGQQWVSWSGDSHEQITFDLGTSGVKVEGMEFGESSE